MAGAAATAVVATATAVVATFTAAALPPLSRACRQPATPPKSEPRRRRFFHGRPLRGSGIGDIGWFTPAGTEMTEADWDEGDAKAMGVFLNGRAIPGRDARGERVAGDSFLVLLNAGTETVGFTLPKGSWW